VCNAYVKNLVSRYLADVERQLRAHGIGGELYVMLSSGGVATVETSRQFPIRLLESGPAAGALAAAHVGGLAGYGDLLSFDMGGTTAKVCLIEDGRPLRTSQLEVDRIYRFKKGSGLPIKIPVIEMIEIGAGGGSIARIDSLGLLQVGPDSAGADHAFGVAAILHSPAVILPLGAGVGSTLGFLTAPLAFDFTRTSVEPLDEMDWTRVNQIRSAMENEGIALLERSGVPGHLISIAYSADLRYVGQGHEVTVPLPRETLSPDSLPRIVEA